jgi:NADH-quinone oxidoreductase subunit F
MSDAPPILLTRPPGAARQDLDAYREEGGYQALESALRTSAAAVLQTIDDARLRGRGGAAFPTAVKWRLAAEQPAQPKFVVANGGEHEPGSAKDKFLVAHYPHKVLEGMLLCGFATGASHGYVYLIEDMAAQIAAATLAIDEMRAANLLGGDICGLGFEFDIEIHRAPTTYVAGEETAAIDSINGGPGKPLAKPPYPGIAGVQGKPTTVNNVETLAAVPHILTGGAGWFKSLARTEDGAGTKLYGLSGHLERTPCLELPIGVPLREIVEVHGGGVRGGRGFKACLPGGASTPYLTAAHLDVALDFAPLEKVGSRFGTGGVTVFDDTTCMVAATLNLNRFFTRESCGWCTPCRDGLYFVSWLLEKIERGEGTMEDIDTLRDQIRNITGTSFCALAQGAVGPLEALLRLFGDEVEDHIKKGRCPLK